ncbi:hypothetical protein LCGC14_1540060 [marine sediment metagenome]|uniref:Uncharacterized protein n=1 Tax=marine sediment metagenome TaxID=412755 RepID=A0A0F9L9D7_9ZZZZ
MDDINSPKQKFYAFAEQTTFGTPIANDGTFKRVAIDSLEVTGRARTYEIPGVGGSDYAQDADIVTLTSGSMPTFTTSGPFTIYNSHEMAYAYFQSVAENAGTFMYSTASGSIKPDFSANEGHFITWLGVYPDAANAGQHLSHKHPDCIASSLKLSCERDGMLMIENNWATRGAGTTNNDTSGATFIDLEGSVHKLGIKDFFQLTVVEIDFLEANGSGVASSAGPELQKFECEFTQDIVKSGLSLDGKTFKNYGIVNRDGTFTIQMLKDATAETSIAQYVTGNPVDIHIRWGSPDVSVVGAVALRLRGKLTADPTFPEEGDIGCIITGRITKVNSAAESSYLRINNGLTESW